MRISKKFPQSKNLPIKPGTAAGEILKARVWVFRIQGIFQLIDCNKLYDLDDGGPLVLSMEQMQGVFMLLDGIAADLDEIDSIVTVYGGESRQVEGVSCSLIRALSIISLVKEVSNSRIGDDSEMLDVSLGSEWGAGFFTALSWAREYLDSVEEGLKYLFLELTANAKGGANAQTP